MKYTPLDIQRREFEKGFRGLDEGEVRAFLLEVAAEWEELQMENSRLRTEILDLRNREKALILREADFKADELLRDAMTKSAEMEAALRSLKLERVRFLQDMDSLLARTRRFLQEEAPEIFPPAEVTRRLDDRDAARLDQLTGQPSTRNGKGGFGTDGL